LHGRGRWVLLVGGLGLLGCAPIPPPDVLGKVDAVRQAPASREAEQYAPTAYRQAERIGREAHRAFEQGELAAAQILGEQALAAYARAVAEARIARADEVRVPAEADADASERELAETDAALVQVEADIAALEQQLAVLEQSSSAQAGSVADPARLQARRQAVATLLWQARLLCTATQLLDAAEPATPLTPLLQGALRELETLEDFIDPLAKRGNPPPLDRAVAARASCLAALSAARGSSQAGSSSTAADGLLAELSQADLGAARRDDRGIVVTLRGLFDRGDRLSRDGRKRLERLARLAEAHPSFPVMVVVHDNPGTGPAQAERSRRRSRALAAVPWLAERAVLSAEGRQPVVDPRSRYRHRNERVEWVFVSP